ncbi:MAG: hypothetical protein ACI4B3_06865 [Prevotella sp.]
MKKIMMTLVMMLTIVVSTSGKNNTNSKVDKNVNVVIVDKQNGGTTWRQTPTCPTHTCGKDVKCKPCKCKKCQKENRKDRPTPPKQNSRSTTTVINVGSMNFSK